MRPINVLDAGVWEEMQLVWAAFPKYAKSRGRMLPFINHRVCARPDEDGCSVKLFKTIARKNGISCVEMTYKVLWAPKVKDNPWWAERAKEGQETFDADYIDMLDDETRMARHIKFMATGSNADYRPMLDGLAMQYEEPKPCLLKLGKNWHTCPFNTSIKVVKQILRLSISDDEKARLLIPYYVRPVRGLPDVPGPGEWLWEDWMNLGARVAQDILERMNNKWRPESYETAHKRAWGKMLGEHPEFNEYKSWVKGVKHSPDYLFARRWDAKATVQRATGKTVDKDEALRALRYDTHCPFMFTVPEGKFASRIINFTATNWKGQMPREDNGSWVSGVKTFKHGKKTRTKEWGMSGYEFNQLPIERRKELLGCSCHDCIQDRVFYQDGDRFMVKEEAILRMPRFKALLPHLLESLELGQYGISDEQFEQLSDSMRLAAKDDSQSLPDVKEDYDMNDPNNIDNDEDWGRFLPPETLQDHIDLALDAELKNGPIIEYKLTQGQLKARWDAEVKALVKEMRAENKAHKKWMKNFRATKTPVIKKTPKLNPPDIREKAREQLDHMLRSNKYQPTTKAVKTATGTPNIPDGYTEDDLRRFMAGEYLKLQTIRAEQCVGKLSPHYMVGGEVHATRKEIRRRPYTSYLRELDTADGGNRVEIYVKYWNLQYRKQDPHGYGPWGLRYPSCRMRKESNVCSEI